MSRPLSFYPTEGVTLVPVAAGQTLNVGDFVSINADGNAVRIFPANAGEVVNFGPNPLYGICLGKTPIDPIHGNKVPVVVLHNRTIWIRWLDGFGNFTIPTGASFTDYVQIRRALGNVNALGASPHDLLNTAHGMVLEANGAWVRVRLRENVFGL